MNDQTQGADVNFELDENAFPENFEYDVELFKAASQIMAQHEVELEETGGVTPTLYLFRTEDGMQKHAKIPVGNKLQDVAVLSAIMVVLRAESAVLCMAAQHEELGPYLAGVCMEKGRTFSLIAPFTAGETDDEPLEFADRRYIDGSCFTDVDHTMLDMPWDDAKKLLTDNFIEFLDKSESKGGDNVQTGNVTH